MVSQWDSRSVPLGQPPERPYGEEPGYSQRPPYDPTLDSPEPRHAPHRVGAPLERDVELHEERLVSRTDLRQLGEVEIRTEAHEFPGRLEVPAYREEIEMEHVPVGEVVQERVAPWEEDGVIVVPVYEEQLVVVKRLVLRERLRIRRVATTETQLFEDTLLRERVVISDPGETGLVRERFPGAPDSGAEPARENGPGQGFVQNLVRRVLR